MAYSFIACRYNKQMILTRTLEQSGPSLEIGDWYCASASSNPKLVVKATDAAKAVAGTVLGIARQKINPGDDFQVMPKIIEHTMDHIFKAQEEGIVSWIITNLDGIVSGPQYVIIDDSAKAVIKPFGPTDGGIGIKDHIVGKVDVTGNIHIFPRRKLSESGIAPLSPGDWYCASASDASLVVKATDAAKAVAGTVLGIVLEKATLGKEFHGQESDTIPSQISGLSVSMSFNKRELVVINDSAKAILGIEGSSNFIGGEFNNETGDLRILPRTLTSVRPIINVTAPPFNAIAYSQFPLADDAKDAGPAIQAAIDALGDLNPYENFSGGIVEIPFGIYRIATPIAIDRAGVTLRGHGGDIFDPGTLLVADAGITPLEVATSLQLDIPPKDLQNVPSGIPKITPNLNDGGRDAKIENICIRTNGKDLFNVSIKSTNDQDVYKHDNEIITINGKNYFTSFIIPMTTESITQFKVGQVIRVAGCGNQILLSRVQAVVSPLSTTVKITQGNGGPFPIPNGAYIIIPGAFEKPTKVIDRPGDQDIFTTESLSENQKTLTSDSIKYVIDNYAKIIEIIDNPPSLIVDSANFNGNSAKQIDVYHGDCGILVHNRCSIENVSIGLSKLNDFPGYGICIDCSHANIPSSNGGNGLRISNYFSLGNQGAIRFTGEDSSGCVIDQIIARDQNNFAIVESSFLGNYYYGLQLYGGYGIICDNVGTRNASTFIGSYFEDGTVGSFGGGSVSIGGHMPQAMGGTSYHNSAAGGGFNRFLLGGIDGLIFNYSVEMEPWAPAGGGNFWALTASNTPELGGSEKSLVFRMSLEGDAGTKGYFMWQHSGASRKIPYCISDSATGLSNTPGELWIPRGFWIGWNGISDLMTEKRARHIWQDVVDPVTLNKPNRVGNIQFYGDSIPGGYIGWTCTKEGTPGNHTTFGQIISHDLLTKSLSTGIVTLSDEECAHKIIRLIGTLIENVEIIVQTPGQFNSPPNSNPPNSPAPTTWDKIIQNKTDGNFTLTIKASPADTGIIIPSNMSQCLWSDGTNIIPAGSAV